MPPTTTTFLNSDFTTGQYKRTLRVASTPSTVPANQRIVATGGTSTTVSAQVLGSGKGWVQSVAPGTYRSNNATSGITFLVFNRVSTIDGVALDVSGANGSGTQDFGDSIFVETGDHASLSAPTAVLQAQPVTFRGSSIVTGTADNKAANDNDLVVFGSDQMKDNKDFTYTIAAGSGATAFSTSIGGLAAPTAKSGGGQSALIVSDSTVSTGNGNDTLIFSNTVAASKIGGGTSGNLFDVGADNDLVYFSTPSQIIENNVVELGSGNDTLIFNGSSKTPASILSGLTGAGASVITVKGFNDAGDRIYFNNTSYTTADKGTITSLSGNKIQFA